MIHLNASFRKIISSSGINFGFRIFGLISTFFATVFISRYFGLATFGSYSLVFTISQAAAIIFALGLPNTLIKIIGNQNYTIQKAKQLLLKGLKAALLFSIIPILFFYFGSDFLANEVFHNIELAKYFIVVTIALPLFIAHELFLYFLIATKSFIKYSFFMFVLPNLLLFGFLYLFYLNGNKGYFSFIAFSLAIFVTVIVEAITVFDWNIRKEKMEFSTRQLLKTASPLLFSGLLLYLLNWTDILMLGAMVNETQVGIYNIAYKVGSVGFLVIVSVSTIITPRMAELFGEGKIKELKKLTHQSTRLIALLSIPVVLVLIIFNKPILSFFGNEAIAGSNSLVIISVGVLFSAMVGNVDQILNMTNNHKILRNITVLCFFVNVILNFILIPKFGIEGAAIASLITNVVINLFCVYYIKKKLGFYTLF